MHLILLGIHDIADRHRAEQALRKSEARFRALATTHAQALFRLSADAAELLELHSRDFLKPLNRPSRTWLTVYVPREDRNRVTAALEAAATKGEVFELEHRVLRQDGTQGWSATRAVPLLGEAGGIREWFGSMSDVTERKHTEEQLRESDRRKDEYLAMLGHELRNPLGAIRNASEIVNRTATDDPRLRRAQGVLGRQTTHISRIIDGLLDVSRIARGKIRLELDPVDLAAVLQRTKDLWLADSSAQGLELVVDASAEPLWVMGDEARLAQILDNLVGNALKFTQAPGTVSLTLARADDRAELRVRDTGAGISPELLTSIFEPFQQAPQDAARSMGGLGLGLSLAKGLVELHRGTIEARSEGLGQGAEFVVRLPLLPPPDAQKASPDAAEATPPRRILLVEDNEDAAEALRDLLDLAGHQVTLAATGPEALTHLKNGGADLVLCDLGVESKEVVHPGLLWES